MHYILFILLLNILLTPIYATSPPAFATLCTCTPQTSYLDPHASFAINDMSWQVTATMSITSRITRESQVLRVYLYEADAESKDPYIYPTAVVLADNEVYRAFIGGKCPLLPHDPYNVTDIQHDLSPCNADGFMKVAYTIDTHSIEFDLPPVLAGKQLFIITIANTAYKSQATLEPFVALPAACAAMKGDYCAVVVPAGLPDGVSTLAVALLLLGLAVILAMSLLILFVKIRAKTTKRGANSRGAPAKQTRTKRSHRKSKSTRTVSAPRYEVLRDERRTPSHAERRNTTVRGLLPSSLEMMNGLL